MRPRPPRAPQMEALGPPRPLCSGIGVSVPESRGVGVTCTPRDAPPRPPQPPIP